MVNFKNPTPIEKRQIRQIPVIGPWFFKAGRVIDVFATPCTPDPIIMVKAAFVGLPYLLWALYKPDPMDQAFERAGIDHKRKRRRRARFRHIHEPDIRPPKNKVSWALWTGAKVAERAGWYMLVMDAALNYLVYWSTMTWTYSGCEVFGANWAQGKVTGGLLNSTGGEWETLSIWGDIQYQDYVMTPVAIEIPSDSVPQVWLMILTQDPPEPRVYPSDLEFRIVIDGNPNPVGNVTPTPNGDGTHGGADLYRQWTPFPATVLYKVQYRCTDGHFSMIGSRFGAYGPNEIGIHKDP